jgi:hypothetical protein
MAAFEKSSLSVEPGERGVWGGTRSSGTSFKENLYAHPEVFVHTAQGSGQG